MEEGTGTPEESWLELSAGLVSGLHHALNNRLGALGAVAQILAGDLEGHPLREALAREVEQLHRTVSLLSLLPRHREAEAAPLQVEEVVDGAIALYRLHHDLRDVPCTASAEGAVPPLHGDAAHLAHILVTVLAAAGARAARLEGGQVRLRYRGDESFVFLTVEALAGEAPFPPTETRLSVDLRALRGWVEAAGGTLAVREGEEGGTYLLRLPTLAEVRRREGGSGV